MMLLLRLIHIAGGVFWAGGMIFVALFLEPSVREAGPDGAKVMQGLMRRNFMLVMPIVALLTILSGIGLLEQVSGGFHPDWMSSATGKTLSLGGAVAIIAFLIGVLVVRPSVIQIGALMGQAAQSPDSAAKDAVLARVQILRGRARVAGRVVAVLLGITVLAMAVARYVG